MGFSEPSAILCDSTSPIPYADASHAKINSKEESKCAKTSERSAIPLRF